MTSAEEQEMHALAVSLEQLTREPHWEAMRYGQIGRTMERLAEYCAVCDCKRVSDVPQPSGAVTESFDASDWARDFIAHVLKNPSIARDVDTMVGWFANAMMRGYDECAKAQAPTRGDDWRPSEVLYAFTGWLTSRPQRTVMGSTCDAAPAADRVAEFCALWGLSEPREHWHKVLSPAAREAGCADAVPTVADGENRT